MADRPWSMPRQATTGATAETDDAKSVSKESVLINYGYKQNNCRMLPVTDFQKIGVGLAGFGIAFLFLGVLFFFDKGLLAIGNILFISGLAFVIGLERTFRFFFQRHKLKATGAFVGGIFVVLMGWPMIGMIVELYGFFLLFGGFLPVAVNFLRRVPVIGTLLNLPGISSLVNRVGEPQGMV